MPIDLNSITDDELLALAGQFGIDTTPFMAGSNLSTGLLDRFSVAPQIPNLGLNIGQPSVSISPEARAAVGAQFEPVRKRAGEELMRTAIEGAGRRGLNLTDTPIWDPLLRNRADLEAQLGGAEALQLLTLSQNVRDFLQRQAEAREGAIQNRFGLQNQTALNNANFVESVRRFQEQLKQQAYQNRLQLSGQQGQLALGLNAARMGTPISTTQIGPLNVGGAAESIGLGLQGLRQTGFF